MIDNYYQSPVPCGTTRWDEHGKWKCRSTWLNKRTRKCQSCSGTVEVVVPLINEVLRQRHIMEDCLAERDRQDNKWGASRNLTGEVWLRILVEEVGEIAHALNEHDDENLREELVQVMATAMAWLENIDRNKVIDDAWGPGY